MIESVLIRNFQSHKKTDMKLHKGVNVIVGPTDSGKTAIIRALHWLIWNKPSGDAFRSTWGGDTIVKVWGQLNSNGHVERGINDEGGYYYLHAKTFKAFGQNVPEEITKALNMSDVNLQQQLDSPFLLSESSGKVAAYFNKVANLDKIDTSRQHVQSQIQATNNSIKYATEQVKSKVLELEQYETLTAFEEELVKVEALEKRKERFNRRVRTLKSLMSDLEIIDITIEEESVKLGAEKQIDSILLKIKQKDALVSERIKLSANIFKLQENERKLGKRKQIIVFEVKVTNLLQKTTATRAFQGQITQFYNLVNKLQAANKRELYIGGKLKQMENTWHKNFPDVCPLCGK